MGFDRIVFTHTAGWLRICTVLFILMGLGLVAGALFMPFDAKPGARPTMLVFGVLVAVMGIVLTFGKLEKTIDHGAATVTDRKLIFGLGRTRVHPLKEFSCVAIQPYGLRSAHGARYARLKVILEGEGRPVYLTEFTHHEQALAKAQEVATLTGLPVTDRSEG